MPPKHYLGMAKTMYNSSITELRFEEESGELSEETLLSERLTRKKWDGSWPVKALESLGAKDKKYTRVFENRDLSTPLFQEELLNRQGPFMDMIEMKGLGSFLSKSPNVQFMGHHIAHAYSALFHAPFEKTYILVMDGGGSRRADLQSCSIFPSLSPSDGKVVSDSLEIEHTSLFFWDGQKLQLLCQEYLDYMEVEGVPLKLAEGIGSFYERAAQLIFNDNLSSGKVMGLAGFGKSFYRKDLSLVENQLLLDWGKCFKGKSKKEWQESPYKSYWQDVAATVQEAFEDNLQKWAQKIKKQNQESLPLIFTGGCALNCSANAKLEKENRQEHFFSKLFVPPNPGDEGISLGLAYGAFLNEGGDRVMREKSHSFSGLKREDNDGVDLFKNYKKSSLKGDLTKVVKILEEEGVIAWYQGRSECGPRALGHRSLLADATQKGVKKFLNQTIKFREDFRPYGASVLSDAVTEYFDCPFDNPFMSFAVAIKDDHKERLKEVCHIDGTCRIQTVDKIRNPIFYKLIKVWQDHGHEPILLNTSLNTMGEPIVESVEDLLSFFEKAEINTLILDDWLIQKETKEW